MPVLHESLSRDALVRKFAPYTDEIFKNESKRMLVVNHDLAWTGAASVLAYKVGAMPTYDYARGGESVPEGYDTRYGKITMLKSVTEEFWIKKDRSFIFFIDKLDDDETMQQLAGGKALSRQTREVVVPEIDSYTYNVMATNAGTIADPLELTPENIYDAILEGTQTLDDAEVPESRRVLVVTPQTYRIMKKNPEIVMETDVGNELRLLGAIGRVDGMTVQKVPSNRLPAGFGFMIAHPQATIAPIKLQDFYMDPNTIYGSGTMVTGRFVYDAFVFDNKKKAIYYHPIAETTA